MDDRQAKRWEAAEEGMELLRTGEADAAIDELLRVIEHDPQNEYAYQFLGHAYFEKHAFSEALKSYVEALRIAPEYVGAMVGAGQALRMMGEYDRAIRMGRQVLRQHPDDPEALFLVGAAHFQRARTRQPSSTSRDSWKPIQSSKSLWKWRACCKWSAARSCLSPAHRTR